MKRNRFCYNYVKRALNRGIGQPWNKVRAKLIEATPHKDLHRLESYLKIHVWTKVSGQGNSAIYRNWVGEEFTTANLAGSFLFVNTCGTLRVIGVTPPEKSVPSQTRLKIDGRYLHRRGGIWFRLATGKFDWAATLAYAARVPASAARYAGTHLDLDTDTFLSKAEHDAKYGENMVPTHWRQLSRAELAKYNLTNDHGAAKA